MSRGYIKTWRQEEEFDLSMPDVQYKIWRLFQIRALHSPFGNLRPGDLRISYSDIQHRLQRADETTVSDKVIKQSIDALVAANYILRVVQKGKPMLIRIADWAKMQGEHPKGHEYIRAGHELPPPAEADPFLGVQRGASPREELHLPKEAAEGSTQGSSKVVPIKRSKASRPPKNAQNAQNV